MIGKRLRAALLILIGLIPVFTPLMSVPVFGADDKSSIISARLLSDQPFSEISNEVPTIERPDWYYDATIYYTVAKNGTIVSNLDDFATLANQTLNDSRGWSQLSAKFVKVESGGTLHLVLAQASLVPSYSPSGCSAQWSCTIGNTVIINDDRWAGASASWNAAGGSLRDYRHMVINHEVGHWLGNGHAFCSASGSPAPVMQQQSIDLMGCVFNPWPLKSELSTSRF